ncbi:MAG: hypothetical protein ACREHE_03565 [Rhizomicrobium sp.]
MPRKLLFAAALLLATAPALAADLNPQPLPPGARDNSASMPGQVATGAHTQMNGSAAAAASDADDNYCGTPTPGHPHAVACTQNNVSTHAMVGSATSGAGAGRMDADDNYCGTRVPGHGPHANWGTTGMRANTAARCNATHGNMQGGAMPH